MPDRPSREYRLAHGPDGLTLLEPVSDPPEAPEEPALPAPAAAPRRASLAPGRMVAWATVAAALLGAGGVSELLRAWRGDGAAEAVAELRDEVRAERAETRSRIDAMASELAALQRRQEAEDAAVRARSAEVRSYLTQARPDAKGALRALGE